MSFFPSGRRVLVAALAFIAALAFGGASALFGVCGPFTDVTDPGFCPFILGILTLGITTGTTPTTYDPTSSVNRLQMAAFLSRTVDGVLKRGSRRAALGQFWAPGSAAILPLTDPGGTPELVACDGTNVASNSVSIVRASTGEVLATLTGNGLNQPWAAAFDGQRVLVTNLGGDSVSLWNAADLTSIGSVPTGPVSGPYGVCSDQLNFWITLRGAKRLARF